MRPSYFPVLATTTRSPPDTDDHAQTAPRASRLPAGNRVQSGAGFLANMPTTYSARPARPPSAHQRQRRHRSTTPPLSAFEREQIAVLHDTAASTLLMVADGATLDPDQLAARARADLVALCAAVPVADQTVDLVDALTQATRIHHTRATIQGPRMLAVAAPTARAVLGAAREALNNVDRHAHAQSVLVDVHARHLTITDDGVGFDVNTTAPGLGITRSITARISRLGGTASITSAPGQGTVVNLGWPTGTAAATETTFHHLSGSTHALLEDIIPVLRRIASGAPIDGRARRLAAVHTRRLRALFDQATRFEHPLLTELRNAIEAAEARGVVVTVHLATTCLCPTPPTAQRSAHR